jgi:hypothetical protein
LAQLQERGYTAPLGLLNHDQAREIREYLCGHLCGDPWRAHFGAFKWDHRPSSEIRMGYYSPEIVLKAPYVLDVFNHPLVLEVAERYLGCKPKLDGVVCWWSFAEHEEAKGTQRFHRDYDTWGGFKIFIYLSDVDEDGGPHVFVEGSHREEKLVTAVAQTDAEISEAFGAGRIADITGPIGHCFLADTFGFHKGAVPKKTPRLILSALFSLGTSPHVPAVPVMPSPSMAYDPYVNQLYLA